MHETGLDNEAKGSISGALSKLLADVYTLYLKTQNFHWNIHGPEFYSLHKLSEEHYKEMAEAVDEIAADYGLATSDIEQAVLYERAA